MTNGGVLSLSHLNLTNGNTTSDGGAIYVDHTSKLYSLKTFFSKNYASNGGGIFGSGKITLLNSSLVKNVARRKGGAMYVIVKNQKDDQNSSSWIDVRYTSIHDNSCLKGAGGGIYSSGNIVFSNSRIFRNKAKEGGGIYLNTNSGTNLFNSELSNNQAVGNEEETDGGGAIYIVGNAKLYIENGMFTNNFASEKGKVIYTSKLGNYTPQVTIVNSNFSDIDKSNQLKSFGGNGGCTGTNGYCGTFSCADRDKNYPCSKLVPDDDCVDYENTHQGVICRPFVVEIVFEGDAVVENEVNQSRGTV